MILLKYPFLLTVRREASETTETFETMRKYFYTNINLKTIVYLYLRYQNLSKALSENKQRSDAAW